MLTKETCPEIFLHTSVMSSSRPATTNRDDDNDEARFRAQAAALAEALRQTEATRPTVHLVVEDTYRQLCFDEPLVTAPDCSALAKALVDESSSYALSNRLVNGVSYLIRQRNVEHNINNVTTTTTTTTSNDEESLINPVQSTTSSESSSPSGYAHIGWTVYGELPLLMLLSDHLTEARALMGSFRAPVTTQDDPEQVEEALNKAAAQEQTRATVEQASIETPVPLADNTDTEEVWAAESDPSDYDFGTTTPAERLTELENVDEDAWISPFSVEPADLSEPLSDTTWSHVADAVTYLLQHLNYSGCLAGLMVQQSTQQQSSWKKLQVTQKLTQLCLTLLLPSAMKSPLFREYPEAHWQQLALTALHAFRDAVEQEQQRVTTTTDTSLLSSLLDEYVNLLVLLLQADQLAPSLPPKDSSSSTTVIAPATLVGLGALSSLCQSRGWEGQQQSSKVLVVRGVRETIFRVADDLAHILELQQGASTTASENTATAVIPWTFLPIWQVLYNQQKHVSPLTATQAQILLQSGMVRQWMLLWQALRSPPLRTAMEQALWNLCCVSPTLLGKYVWRFAGFAAHVTTESLPTAVSDTSAMFGWNLLGIHLAEQAAAGGAGLVRLNKNNEDSRPAPTVAVCTKQSIQSFRDMIQTIVEYLVAWKGRRDGEVQDTTDSEVPEETKQDFENFLAVVKSLSIPLVQQLFLERLVQPDNGFDITTTVAPIRKILVAWPSPKSDEDSKKKLFIAKVDHDEQQAKEEKPSDNMERPKRKRGRRQVEDEMVAALRKSLKVLQSTLESSGSDFRFSSKAD